MVVAKCGLYLKEHATEIEGTFRISGSTKRMRELQTLFDTGPKVSDPRRHSQTTLNWFADYFSLARTSTGPNLRSRHTMWPPSLDASLHKHQSPSFPTTSITRSVPSIPIKEPAGVLTSQFRGVDREDIDYAVKEYKSLIRAMPPVNQYLLLYVLDLLSVFARKSDVNLMTAPSELDYGAGQGIAPLTT